MPRDLQGETETFIKYLAVHSETSGRDHLVKIRTQDKLARKPLRSIYKERKDRDVELIDRLYKRSRS